MQCYMKPCAYFACDVVGHYGASAIMVPAKSTYLDTHLPLAVIAASLHMHHLASLVVLSCACSHAPQHD